MFGKIAPISLSTRLAVYYCAFQSSAGQSLISTTYAHNTTTFTHNTTINTASYGNPIRETFNLFIRSLYCTGRRKLPLFFLTSICGKTQRVPGSLHVVQNDSLVYQNIFSLYKIRFLKLFQYACALTAFLRFITPILLIEQRPLHAYFHNLAAESDHLFLPFTSII